MNADVRINAEIVYATLDRQEIVYLQLDRGATVEDAIERSNLKNRFPLEPLDSCPTGIWGRPVARNQVLVDGDRVELYRQLLHDPREARRERA
jgi:putative ubiquitin-RnfH superfamily antitoxin RatB of RatAB toxin-antitoxin module